MGHTKVHTDKAGQAPIRLAFTIQETAAMLGISYVTVHRLLKRGLLQSSSVLRRRLIPATEIERFLKATTHDQRHDAKVNH